jgi:CubicO group peptidase (beta-lactamase class C family)
MRIATAVRRWTVSGIVILPLVVACEPRSHIGDALPTFEATLDSLREEHRIPGMSVAVVHDGALLWTRGFGFADLATQAPATASTPYNIASLTKPLAAVLLMQLVEEGALDLDAPMADVLANATFPLRYRGVRVQGYAAFCRLVREAVTDETHPLHPVVADGHKAYLCDTEHPTVRHHLSHTAEGVPGTRFQYNGDLYGWLATAAEAASGRAFRELLVDRIVRPAGMTSTIPSVDDSTREAVRQRRATYYGDTSDGYASVDVIRPFGWPAELEELGLEIDVAFAVNAGAGVVSTVTDLAACDIALDDNRLLGAAAKAVMLAPTVTNDGDTLFYALGWFVQEVGQTPLVWHYGHGGVYSSLYLKVPSRRLTFLLLANSGGASAPYPWERGDVLVSPFARAFLEDIAGLELPSPAEP